MRRVPAPKYLGHDRACPSREFLTQLRFQNLARAIECNIDVRTNIIETDPVHEAGMKQHFHWLRLHATEEKLGSFTMKFIQRNFERV